MSLSPAAKFEFLLLQYSTICLLLQNDSKKITYCGRSNNFYFINWKCNFVLSYFSWKENCEISCFLKKLCLALFHGKVYIFWIVFSLPLVLGKSLILGDKSISKTSCPSDCVDIIHTTIATSYPIELFKLSFSPPPPPPAFPLPPPHQLWVKRERDTATAEWVPPPSPHTSPCSRGQPWWGGGAGWWAVS